MQTTLRITGKQHKYLFRHLFPGDDKEAVALLLCGRVERANKMILCVHSVIPIPYEECITRDDKSVKWETTTLFPVMEKIIKENLAVVKIHSHPEHCNEFSVTDDRSDKLFYQSVCGWTTNELHASLIMLPSGKIFGRTIDSTGRFLPLDTVSVAGDEIQFWRTGKSEGSYSEENKRNLQTFGEGTIANLQHLSAAVVGCSGTGSIVIQQLARLGIGNLVLVDPDQVERKNLNRIVGATAEDARMANLKVNVMRRIVGEIGMGTTVEAYGENIFPSERVIRAVSECDLIFGCVDGVIGRHILNKIATFYSIPYFDIGVKLEADGKGGINGIFGTVHYMQPDGSDLLDRGVYTLSDLGSAFQFMKNPKVYSDRLKDGYIKNTDGIAVERPAVISVNMQIASIAINEFLARIHSYRIEDNKEYAIHRIDLVNVMEPVEEEPEASASAVRNVGRGDVKPLLDLSY
jgi:hypothetical protein